MEFGTFMEFHIRPGRSQADDFAEAFRQVDLAEDLGLDCIWMAESHFNPERAVLSSPMVVGTAIAAKTQRIKIGTAVQVLPLGEPLRIAEEAASLDQISQGRLQFGVGRSGLPGSYEGYNKDYGQSTERVYEDLEIIIKAWTEERFSYEGKYHSYEDVCLVPKPYQSPHPPVRMAANSSATFPVVGRRNLPLFVGVRQLGASLVAEYVESYQQAREEAGFEGPPDVSIRIPVYVAESREEAVTAPEQSFMKQFRRLGNQIAASTSRTGVNAVDERATRSTELAEVEWDEVQREKVIVGTPEMVIDRIHEIKEQLHLTELVAEFNAGELISEPEIARSMRLMCEKVIPEFK